MPWHEWAGHTTTAGVTVVELPPDFPDLPCPLTPELCVFVDGRILEAKTQYRTVDDKLIELFPLDYMSTVLVRLWRDR